MKDYNGINNQLSQALLDRGLVPDFLSELGIQPAKGLDRENVFRGPCPVHLGDGPNFEVKTEGRALPVHWRCFSKQCEATFKPSLLGLVRGVLTAQSLKPVRMKVVVQYVEDFLKARSAGLVTAPPKATSAPTTPKREFPKLTRQQVRSRLEIPSCYFLKRGFSEKLLDEMDVGFCSDRTKPFFGRHLVPVYDDDGQFCVGVLGRSPYEACPAPGCGLHHRPGSPCPSRDRREAFSKWRNSAGFAKGTFLYNYASARRADSPFVLLVEGPCDAWKTAEAGVPAVAVMGVELTRTQAEKLARLGKMVRVAFDNDDAGEKGLSRAADQLSKFGVWWEPVKVPAMYHDVGEMPSSEVAVWLGTRASPCPV